MSCYQPLQAVDSIPHSNIMKLSSPSIRVALAALFFLVLVLMSGCKPQSVSADPVVRGAHLVTKVAMCQDCHSPRLADGQFDPENWLAGSPLGFQPLMEMPWSPVAPPIAGLPTLTDEEAFTFLTTGALPEGRRPLPPMPEYRFAPDEANDVIAYLKSLE